MARLEIVELLWRKALVGGICFAPSARPKSSLSAPF